MKARLIVRVALAASLGVILLAQSALALEPVGGPNVDRLGWSQKFTVYNSNQFNHIQLAMYEGGPFQTPQGFDPTQFVPADWTQLAYNPTTDAIQLIANGATSTNTLQFKVKFASPIGQPLTFFYQLWGETPEHARVFVTEATAHWDGSQWTVTGGSPWADAFVSGACPHVGELRLLTEPGDQVCYDPEPEQLNPNIVTVAVKMTNVVDPYVVVGGQFFLSYDPARLEFLSADPGDAPFLKQIYEAVDPYAGTIDYAVGLNFGGTGTTADTVLARLTFRAINEVCLSTDLVTFRNSNPPSMLTSGCCGDVCPLMYELTAIEIDGTDPVFGACPPDVTVECNAIPWVPPRADLLISDNCTEPNAIALEFVQVPAFTGDPENPVNPADIPSCENYTITRTWTATDFCGNESVCEQIITVKDRTAPCLHNCPQDDTIECSDLATLYPVYDCYGNLIVFAQDNCDENPTVTFEEYYVYPDPNCVGNATLTRTWTAKDACNNTAYCTQVLILHDTTAPVWSADVYDPNLPWTDRVVACDAIPPRCDPGATDNCTGEVLLTYNEYFTGHQCVDTYTITRVWEYADYCGNAISRTQHISVVDNVNPAFANCPDPEITVECDSVPSIPTLTATDNCDTSPEVTFVEYQTNGDCNDNYTLRRLWTATDNCGNSTTCDQIIHVVDRTDPVITCPEPIEVKADVGHCYATLCPGFATATDNCWDPNDPEDPRVIVAGYRHDGLGLCTDPYPVGDTLITWAAVDDCGNIATCQQIITVLPINELEVRLPVQMTYPDTSGGTVTRCITFEFWNCQDPNGVPVVFEAELAFHGDGAPTIAVAHEVLDIPCGDYTCITARDGLHTLGITLSGPEFRIHNGQYKANFAAADKKLLGGNANGDCVIDIRDYGKFVCDWNKCYDSDENNVPDGHTPCGMFTLHADFSGDGCVWQEDFMYIRNNFLKTCDDDCCVTRGGADYVPVTSLKVADLLAQGEFGMASADLNTDGYVDVQDMVAFMHGARPKPMLQPGVTPTPGLERSKEK